MLVFTLWYIFSHDKVTIQCHNLLRYKHNSTVLILMYVVLPVFFLWSSNVSKKQLIFSESLCQKWPWLYYLDNRSYSTIQPSIFSTYNNLRLKYGQPFWNCSIFESNIDPDYTPKRKSTDTSNFHIHYSASRCQHNYLKIYSTG